MPISSPHSEIIDLTTPDSRSWSSRPGPNPPSGTVDLTLSYSDEEHAPLNDHMHTVLDIIRPGAIDLTGIETSSRRKRKDAGVAGHRHKSRRIQSSHYTASSIETDRENAPVVPGMRQSSQRNGEIMYLSNASFTYSNAPLQLEPMGSPGVQAQKVGKRSFKPFPFRDFPPEIRNLVYRLLLTTPLTPIELPELTGRNGAAHRAQWAKCTTSKMRRKHKKLFLEILETCKQVHDEASGILYGCNVFKYRSNPGARSNRVVLPTRHLQLLKHIKVSVMSRGRWGNQDEQVADLVREFVRDGLTLDTFEITWWGEDRYRLRADSPMCLVLGSLAVEKHFIMKVAGQARMEKAMKDELERVLLSEGSKIMVEIHRPVKENGGELSDESEPDVWQ